MNLFHIKVQTSTIQPEPSIPKLRLPNLALDSANLKVVEKRLSELKNWSGVANSIPKEARFVFLWGTVEISGDIVRVSATIPGEYAIPIPLCNAGQSDILLLQITVIQDPWVLLLQEKESPPKAPYFKDHKVHKTWQLGMLNGHIVAASRRGQGHACHGTFRDDDYKVEQIAEKGLFLIAVADGAGSARYARKGSQIVVEEAIKSLRAELEKEDNLSALEGLTFEDTAGELLVSAAKACKKAINDEVNKFNAAPLETGPSVSAHDYNTTILLSLIKAIPGNGIRIASFAIGDGAIVWIPENSSTFALLSQPDDGEFAGETEFVTSESIWRQDDMDHAAFLKRRVRTMRMEEREARHGTLLMMTDGVSDPFFASHAKLKDYDIWRTFLDSKIRQEAKIEKNTSPSDELSGQLLSWLNFKATTHFDDRTLVIWELFDSEISCKQDETKANIDHNSEQEAK